MSTGIFIAALGTEAGGMETYEQSFLRALASIDQQNHYEIFCLSEKARQALGIKQTNFDYRVLFPQSRWISMSVTLPALLYASKIKLFHPTYVPPMFCPKPYVYTVHSSVTWTHPHFYPDKIRWRVNRLQEKGVREARMLLCVSQHVKDFIADRFNVPEERLAVVYHGVSPHFKPREEREYKEHLHERYGLSGRYFLFAGKLKENKNISGLIKAFMLFREQTKSDVKLVLAGRRLWSEGTLDQEINKACESGAVVELGHIDHEDMPLLYNSALALTFPSFWEGFGIPILEAQASGTPVMTSNNSSLPEASGGHALHIDPESIEEMADAMRQLAENTELRKTLRKNGIENAKKFTWEQAARQTLAAYNRVL